MSLQSAYRKACDDYLAAFAEKHEFAMHDCSWVADEPGGTALIGDYCASMTEIIADIDCDAPVDEWIAYYDYSIECADLGLPYCSYRNWLRNCPTYSPEKLAELRALKHNVEEAGEIFRKAVKEAKEEF